MSLEIPEAVYRGVERGDAEDIRVFDADGSLVPFVVRKYPAVKTARENESVPFFVWGENSKEEEPGAGDIEINATGAVVKIKGVAQSSPSAYLVDLSALNESPESLRITLERSAGFYHSAVTVSASDDLNRWRDFNRTQTVAWYGNSGADRPLVEIPLAARYLLIRFEKGAPPLERLDAVFAPRDFPSPTRQNRVAGQKSADSKRVDYDTGGFYPLTSIDFTLREPDSVSAFVKSRYTQTDSWRAEQTARIFLMPQDSSGEIRTGGPIAVSSSARYWELEAQGELKFSQTPECVFSWEPRELVFLARGNGPWTLAFGNAEYAAFDDGALRLTGDETFVPSAIEGDVRYAPRAVEKKVERKPWILWGVLVFAVVALCALAYSIAKSMKMEEHR
jgi:hypothetical protein